MPTILLIWCYSFRKPYSKENHRLLNIKELVVSVSTGCGRTLQRKERLKSIDKRKLRNRFEKKELYKS